MKLVEHELKQIADEQGANVTDMVELVKENEKIVSAMQVGFYLVVSVTP